MSRLLIAERAAMENNRCKDRGRSVVGGHSSNSTTSTRCRSVVQRAVQRAVQQIHHMEYKSTKSKTYRSYSFLYTTSSPTTTNRSGGV